MWVVGILVVAAAAWFIWKQTSGPVAVQQPTQQVQQQQPAQQQQSGGLSASGNTDAELSSDMNQIDAGVDGAGSAAASASQADQPVQQTE